MHLQQRNPGLCPGKERLIAKLPIGEASASRMRLIPMEDHRHGNYPQLLRKRVHRRQTAGVAPVMRRTHLVMWAWSANPVSTAILHK